MQRQIGRSKRKLQLKGDESLSKYVSIAQARAKERAKDALRIIRQSRMQYEFEHSDSPLKERPLSGKSRSTLGHLRVQQGENKEKTKKRTLITNDADLNLYQPSRPGIWDDEVRKEREAADAEIGKAETPKAT